jgi:hypothetical protein
MESIGFSDFRYLMDLWDEAIDQDKQSKIRSILDGAGLVMFFSKDGEFFGAPEDSRVTFARMKQPDEDADKNWRKEANFLAINLSKAIKGSPDKNVFGLDALSKVKIMDKEDVFKLLAKAAKTIAHDAVTAGFIQATKEPPNLIPLDDEE